MRRYAFTATALLLFGCGNCGEPANNDNDMDPNIITEGDMFMPQADAGDGGDAGGVDMMPEVDMNLPPVPELVFDRSDLILRQGDTRELGVMVSLGDELFMPEMVTWTSEDESLVTVNEEGLVTALDEEGATFIAATTTFVEQELSARLRTTVISPYRALGVGRAHTCGATEGGSLFCWGDNTDEQAGLPTTRVYDRPYPVATSTVFAQLSLGSNHTCGVDSGGGVMCWGDNSTLQAGRPGAGVVDLPETVIPSGVASVATGDDFSCAIDEFDSFEPNSAALRCWGSNEFGQLGSDTVPTETESPTEVAIGGQWRSVTAGTHHACGITFDGVAYCWGDNRASQLGDSTVMAQTSTPVALSGSYSRIAAGGDQTCAVDSTGALFCWGTSTGGIGNGSNSSASPVLIATPDDVIPNGLAVGENFACATTPSNGVFCWGVNDRGQLGDMTTESREATDWVSGQPPLESLQAGEAHVCGLNETGDAFCWGANDVGQVGDGSEVDRRNPAVVATPVDPG